jgi:hypothetical protein
MNPENYLDLERPRLNAPSDFGARFMTYQKCGPSWRTLRSHSLAAIRLMLCLCLLLFVWEGEDRCQTPGGSNPNSMELHGGIEISPRIIRVIALRISNRADGENVQILHSDQIAPSIPIPTDERLTPEYIRELALSVQKLFDSLRRDFRVPPDQIHLLGLSEFAAQIRDDLAREIRAKTGKEITFLDAKSETELSIAGNIPRRYQLDGKWYDNRNISMLLDIGQSSVRGGHQQLRQSARGRTEYDYVTWEIPKGVSSLAAEAGKRLGEDADLQSFAKTVAINSNSFRGLLRTEVSHNVGLMTRKKIYLTGDIVWAMVTLLHPDDQRPYVSLTIEDINTFAYRAGADPEALLNPDLSKIRDENARNDAKKAREMVKGAYTPKMLIAGAETMKAVAGEMNLADKRMIYARHSPLARILSYLRLQIE